MSCPRATIEELRMSLLSAVALVTCVSLCPAPAVPADTGVRAVAVISDTGRGATADSIERAAAGAAATPMAPAPVSLSPVALGRRPVQDTLPRKRAKAVTYSDGYEKRLTLHRTLSWAMLPLFALSYVSGDQLLDKGSDAPGWARSVHPVAATGTAVLFGANAVTGTWNLWEGRKDPNGRARRLVHSALFLAASGGFSYAGTIADEAEQNGDKRRQHRTVALTSMGLSTASWLIMLIGN